MHVIQWIATKANDVDEAHSKVKHYLEGILGDDPYTAPSATWYDWFVVGGGRWASNNEPYDDNFTGDIAHQDSPKFQEYLDNAVKYRQQELATYEAEARKINLIELLDNLKDFDGDRFPVGTKLYPINKIYDMTIGDWDYTSYFYDIEHDSPNSIHMRETIDNGDKDWYLVPVDFHF